MLAGDNSSPEALTTPAPQAFVKYAIRPINEIYHLVTRGGQNTMCGLRVSRIISDRPGSRLQLVPEVPSGRTICKHCYRIQRQDANDLV